MHVAPSIFTLFINFIVETSALLLFFKLCQLLLFRREMCLFIQSSYEVEIFESAKLLRIK